MGDSPAVELLPRCQDRDSKASGSGLEMPPIERHYRFGVSIDRRLEYQIIIRIRQRRPPQIRNPNRYRHQSERAEEDLDVRF
jgi:hypothetical protein